MRVVISSRGRPLEPQLRSYAEYRFFSTLAPHDNVAGARVQLRADEEAVQCQVQVMLHPGGSLQARASAPHAAAAIDRAAERVAALIDEQRIVISF